jgi:type III secretory pathway component EscU
MVLIILAMFAVAGAVVSIEQDNKDEITQVREDMRKDFEIRNLRRRLRHEAQHSYAGSEVLVPAPRVEEITLEKKTEWRRK